MIYVYTGLSACKTTSALGLCLRALGHGKKVVIIQFMKGRKDIGEYKIRNKLKNYEIYQFGRKEFVNLNNPSKKDKDLAKKGLEFAKTIIKNKPFIMVLDEINLAIKVGLLNEKDVLDFLDNIPKNVNVILTGRYASKKIIKKSDIAIETRELKAPKKYPYIKGLQY
ncbi:MAG: cob(I)yrinic acid a,c-diamide adenosyltransferase [Candidatus Aenigmarchaeota archaeon]|nr:cob(I)yrinic acid a,c-diamide adenosyltransferase [Candidatus Aenigmarchaeota archaeon]